jgi:ligand-binding SRPBCC domain-containing protein
MAIILLSTFIGAPRERVFDLARSIDAHQKSTENTGERAIAGVTTGLIGMNDEVTWEARHLGVKQRLTVRVTVFEQSSHFQDVMVQGAFKRMIHDHSFAEVSSGTNMTDRLEFESPFGILGWTFDRLFLSGYLRRFLVERNRRLKELAETEEWREYLEDRRQAAP